MSLSRRGLLPVRRNSSQRTFVSASPATPSGYELTARFPHRAGDKRRHPHGERPRRDGDRPPPGERARDRDRGERDRDQREERRERHESSLLRRRRSRASRRVQSGGRTEGRSSTGRAPVSKTGG